MKITAKDFGDGKLVKFRNRIEFFDADDVEQKHVVVNDADCVVSDVYVRHVQHVQLNMLHYIYYNRDGYKEALQIINQERIDTLIQMRRAIVCSCYEASENDDYTNYEYNLKTIDMYSNFKPTSIETPKELKQKWAELRSRGWK